MLPAGLLEAEERLRASVSAGEKLEFGDRVPGRNGQRRRHHHPLHRAAALDIAVFRRLKRDIGFVLGGALIRRFRPGAEQFGGKRRTPDFTDS